MSIQVTKFKNKAAEWADQVATWAFTDAQEAGCAHDEAVDHVIGEMADEYAECQDPEVKKFLISFMWIIYDPTRRGRA